MPAKYKMPPLIEVVCEFRFDPTSAWDMVMPGLLFEQVRTTHPKRRDAVSIEVAITAQIPKQQAWQRIQFLSEDGKDIIQVGQHLLAVNRLQPYDSWEEFLPKIKKAYDAYCKVASPQGISRIGLRYINRIVIPREEIRTEDYFEFYPYLGPRLPGMHGPFTVGVQFSFRNEADGLRAELQSGAEHSPGTYSLILDLDYYLTDPTKLGGQDPFDWLGGAHGKIEEVFEACLTPITRELFQPINHQS